jgi:hypothetical protein
MDKFWSIGIIVNNVHFLNIGFNFPRFGVSWSLRWFWKVEIRGNRYVECEEELVVDEPPWWSEPGKPDKAKTPTTFKGNYPKE